MSTTQWAATIEVAAPSPTDTISDEAIDLAVDRLLEHGGAVSVGHGHVGATFTVDGTTPSRAIATAQATFTDALAGSGAERWPVVAAEVLTLDEQDRRLELPLIPELVGLGEAAEILKVSKQRVGQLDRERHDFPTPVQRLASGPVWVRHAIVAFDERWERKAGRPKKEAEVPAAAGTVLPDGRVAHQTGIYKAAKRFDRAVSKPAKSPAGRALSATGKKAAAKASVSKARRSSKS